MYLKCPFCGNEVSENAAYCDVCRKPLPKKNIPNEEGRRRKRTRFQKFLFAVAWIMALTAVAVGIYKLLFWYDQYKVNRLYTTGAYAPIVNEIEMDDGRVGHALIFYGNDGDMVYLPELGESLSICGGIARLEIADASWFASDVAQYDYATITFTPVLLKEKGGELQLPTITYPVDVPNSPITVKSPASENTTVVTSSYPIELEVVAGSEVFINGENLTDSVDRSGALDVNVAVQPIGNNTYTVIVRTPQHKETRKDIVIYREKHDIEIELDSNVSTKTNSETMTISGRCEIGAMITVDTKYLENSLEVDMTTGRFSFIVQFDQLGDNVVRFHASKEGRQDATISFTINYIPTLAQYSAKAWRMDYAQLRLLYNDWVGKIFLCRGPIIDQFTENDTLYLVMNVAPDGEEQQLVILQNSSSAKSFTLGPKYDAYADVAGHMMYNSEYYPLLVARYIDLYTAK